MNTKTLNIITITLIFMIALLGIILNFEKIIYAQDMIKSSFLNIFPNNHEENHIKIIDPHNQKLFYNPYKNLEENIFHSGPFLFYRANNKTSIKTIASKTIRYTHFYKTINLRTAIRENNIITEEYIEKDEVVIIPNSLNSQITDVRNHKKPEIVFTKGLYFTGNSAGKSDFIQKIKDLKNKNINAIVFDIKDVTGHVTYKSDIAEVVNYDSHKKYTIGNIEKLIREMKQNNIYSIARIAVFRDHLLAQKNPSLAIRSNTTGDIWNKNKSEIWCDPTNKEVQDYNINLALELAELGVDEIQFDYIRFPTSGKLSDARYKYDFGKMEKEDTITHFLKRAYEKISGKNTNLSIDIFGVVAWGKNVDIKKTGQRISKLSEYCDIISPMLYPSHFEDGFDSRNNPGDDPYYFILTGCQKVLSKSRKNIIVRPWLQAFKWRVSNYGPSYIIDQVKASNDSGSRGYLFWNSKNKYETVLEAMKHFK